MDIEEINGYNKEKENKYNITRDKYLGITQMHCKKHGFITCLNYLEKAGFFPNKVTIFIDNQKIIIYRNSLSGRAYINETKSDMWEDDYPQRFNDIRIINEIKELI